MPIIHKNKMPFKAEAEIRNLKAKAMKQEGVIEYISMMTDVDIPVDEEMEGDDHEQEV